MGHTDNILNWNWYRSLFKGKYTPVRFLQTVVNVLLFIDVAGIMASGIMLSQEVFGFLGIRAGMFGRRLHMASTAWGFVLMSAHLGMHIGMIAGIIRKQMGKGSENRIVHILLDLAAAGISVYGAYIFIVRNLGKYMLLTMDFAFFDFDEAPVYFYLDYIAVMGLFACIFYYSSKLLRFSDKRAVVIIRNRRVYIKGIVAGRHNYR